MLKQQIIEFGKKLYDKDLTFATSGNISLKTDEGILITASGSALGHLTSDDISLIDFEGNLVAGKKPSCEKMLHVEVYKQRADVRAIIHTHPVNLTSFAVCHESLKEPIMSENILYFPGKNGLDLNLNCSYNSQSIKDTYFQDGTYYDNTYFRGVYYYDYINENGFTKTILILFDSEDELWENASVSFTAKELPDVRDDDNGDEYYMFSDFDIVSEGGITFTRNLEKHPIELEFSRRDKYTEAMISPERTHFSDMWDWNIPTIYETIHPTLTESVDGVKIYDLVRLFG